MNPTRQYVRSITLLATKPIRNYATCPHAIEANAHAALNEEVKPYSEVPGPKPLPILGNTWR